MTATANTGVSVGNDSAEILTGTSVGAISGGGGNDTIQGAINGVAPGSTLSGGIGSDSITSRGIGDLVFGDAGDDFIRSESGQAALYGGADDDTILGEDSQTTVYGGAGDDSILFQDKQNVGYGDAGDDTIIGLDGGDVFIGGAGDDYLKAAASSKDATVLFGNSGDDSLYLGNTSSDSAYGGQGEDYIFAGSNASADNQYLGGDKGADKIVYLGKGDGIILDGDRGALGQAVSGTDAGADTFVLSSTGTDLPTDLSILGGGGADSVVGFAEGTNTAAAQLGEGASVFGGKGDDYINAVSSGSSQISGDLGNDIIAVVAAGNDSIFGDGISQGSGVTLGSDKLTITGSGGNVVFGDTASGTDGANDTIDATGAGSGNVIYGGGGNDSLVSAGDNTLIGGAGNDIYRLGAGDYVPFDSLGVNTYVAGTDVSTADVVTVNPTDSFTGGATFLIADGNTISQVKDLASGGVVTGDNKDVITIANVDGKSSLGGGNDVFTGDVFTATGGVDAGSGDDVITFTGSSIGAGSVAGGNGDDDILFTNSAAVVAANVDGGSGSDRLVAAGTFAGVFSGGDGNDFFGDAGAGSGVSVGASASIDAGAGNDVVNIKSFGTDAEAVSVAGGIGDDVISAADAKGTTPFTLTLDGGDGNDIIYGKEAGGDVINGGKGNDTLFGGGFGATPTTTGTDAANNRALGDELTGGDGADVFIFGTIAKVGFAGGEITGTATLDALSTDDGYIFDGPTGSTSTVGFFNGVLHVDTITDFKSGEDKIFINTSGGFANVALADFAKGSIEYLSDDGAIGGFIVGKTGATGSGNTVGLIGDGTFTAASTNVDKFVVDGYGTKSTAPFYVDYTGTNSLELLSAPTFAVYDPAGNLGGTTGTQLAVDASLENVGVDPNTGNGTTEGAITITASPTQLNPNFSLDGGGTGVGEINFGVGNFLTLDTNTGGLYYNATLLAVFSDADKGAGLQYTDFVFTGFDSNTGSIPSTVF